MNNSFSMSLDIILLLPVYVYMLPVVYIFAINKDFDISVFTPSLNLNETVRLVFWLVGYEKM